MTGRTSIDIKIALSIKNNASIVSINYSSAWPGNTNASPSVACLHSPCLAMARHSLQSTLPFWTQLSTPRPWLPTPGWLPRLLPAVSTPSWLLMDVRYNSFPSSSLNHLNRISIFFWLNQTLSPGPAVHWLLGAFNGLTWRLASAGHRNSSPHKLAGWKELRWDILVKNLL